ncbi:MAG: YbaK/EbsC family protein [Phycisphaerales bacterium]|nr:YbaK/EbsC family protein [Phycisphaerales bacterium]
MDVFEYLIDEGVSYIADEHPPAYTAQDVAANEHVSGDIVAKSVIVNDGGEYIMCVLPASYRLDMGKVAKVLDTEEVRLASEDEMGEIFDDCELGAEPPFGNLYYMDTVVDQHLADDEEIVFQAGSHSQSVRMRYTDYQSLTKPKVADFAEHV